MAKAQQQGVEQLFARAVELHRAGRSAEAEQLYRQVVERDQQHERAWFLLAALELEAGRAPAGVSILERLVTAHPQNAIYLANLGEAYRRVGQPERAISALATAIKLNPGLVPAHFNLGLSARALGDETSALKAFETAAELKPGDAQIQHALARALLEQRDYLRALGHFQCGLALRPDSLELLLDYASCLRNAGRLEAALRSAARAAELSPSSAPVQRELSAVLVELGRFDEALQSSQKALQLDPSSAAAHCGLAAALTDTGHLDEALDAYRKAIELDPTDVLAHSNLIFLLPFQRGTTAADVLAEARRWAEQHAAPLAEHVRAFDNGRDAERRLRVGYVSSNYNEHCQALFTLPLLAHHDRSRFELFAYSATLKTDATTERLRAQFAGWHSIAGLTAPEAAALIRSHGIDILIDLTMHMAVTQLPIFACKPAPVQIAWLAYPGTTGVATIDYRVTDRLLDPPGSSDDAYSEASLVLPDTFWLYAPNSSQPVSGLPARKSGHVTFGCLSSFWKVNDITLQLWAEVLQAVPGSRLLLLAPEGSARAHVLEVLAAGGVTADRVELVSRRPRADYLELYDRIDVCLDTLPYNGHTTSLDAWWMGVPTLTLVGDTAVGRAGLCQATNLQLSELVAQTPAELVSIAARVAGDLEALSELRASLRQRLERSPLMDAPKFARELEAVYRDAFRRWCESGR